MRTAARDLKWPRAVLRVACVALTCLGISGCTDRDRVGVGLMIVAMLTGMGLLVQAALTAVGHSGRAGTMMLALSFTLSICQGLLMLAGISGVFELPRAVRFEVLGELLCVLFCGFIQTLLVSLLGAAIAGPPVDAEIAAELGVARRRVPIVATSAAVYVLMAGALLTFLFAPLA